MMMNELKEVCQVESNHYFMILVKLCFARWIGSERIVILDLTNNVLSYIILNNVVPIIVSSIKINLFCIFNFCTRGNGDIRDKIIKTCNYIINLKIALDHNMYFMIHSQYSQIDLIYLFIIKVKKQLKISVIIKRNLSVIKFFNQYFNFIMV